MPGDWFIEYAQIRNFRERKDFVIMDSDGNNHHIRYDGEILSAYNYYFEIWDNCHEFGLPGDDWSLNPSWLVNHVKRFNRILKEINYYREPKR